MDFHFCYVHHVISIQMFYKRMCSCNIDVEKERKKMQNKTMHLHTLKIVSML